MAHGQNCDFWARSAHGCGYTVNMNTVKIMHHGYEQKTEKDEKIKCERTHKTSQGSVRKIKASVAAALIKIKAEKAALLVSASYLEEMHMLEAKQSAIRRKLEELELKTKLAEVTAKLAVLNASKKYRHKADKFKSDTEEPKLHTLSQVSKLCPLNQTTIVSVLCDQTGAGDDELDEVNWEEPQICATLIGPFKPTGAGTTTEMVYSHIESPPVGSTESQELQRDAKIPANRQQEPSLKTKQDSTFQGVNESCADQPLTEMVGGTEDEEQEKTAVPVPVDIERPVEEKPPLLEPVKSSSKDTPGMSFYFAVNKMGDVAQPSLWFGVPMYFKGDLIDSYFEKCSISIVFFVLYLLVCQAQKLFQLKQYKAFKRKRWKMFYRLIA